MCDLKKYIREENLVFPNYKDANIVDLVKCLYIKQGYNIEKNENVIRFDKIIPNNKHYLFIISDGTGSNIIRKLSDDSILRKNLKEDILTVFPSTTGCVLTSVVTASFPEEHGIWGWFNYNRKLNRDYYPVLFSDRKTMKSLDKFNISNNDIYIKESVLGKMNKNVNVLFPSYINDSVYSNFVFNDKNRQPYTTFDDIKLKIKNICDTEESSYTYLYLPEIDNIEHENGVYSDLTLKKLNEINELVESLTVNKNLTIVFTADHGQTDITNDIVMDFKKYEKYFYAYPSIDFGTASYYIKNGYEKEFIYEFEKDFKNEMKLFKTEEFIKCNMFGIGNISEYAKENLGEYISLCKDGYYLINTTDIESYYGKIKGNHSGLTKDEMTIPLIIINTNDIK